MTRSQGYAMAAATFVVLFVVMTRVEARGSGANAYASAQSSRTKLVASLRDGVFRIETPCSVFEKSGTGFLVGPQLVATALHVVNGADTVSLFQDGQPIATGAVVGRDYAHDLALVQIDKSLAGHVFTLSPEPAVPGEAVGALGFTGGQDTLREAEGTVIGSHRVIVLYGLERPDLVEVAMPLGHGDSGGPIFDLRDGRVLAVVDAGPEQMGIGFGVDAQVARPLIGEWAATPEPIRGSSC